MSNEDLFLFILPGDEGVCTDIRRNVNRLLPYLEFYLGGCFESSLMLMAIYIFHFLGIQLFFGYN